MNRTIKIINSKKWYHVKTLEKFYKDYTKLYTTRKTIEGVEYEVVRFHRPWNDCFFVIHPRTKRLRFHSIEALQEIGIVPQ